MTTRDDAMRRLGYGREWIEAAAIDEDLLEQQARSTDHGTPEHHRWAMFRQYARRNVRWDVPLPDARLDALLALDLAEAGARHPNFGHSIAHYVAQYAAPDRGQIERLCAHPIRGSRRAFERHLLQRAIELEKTNDWRPERERSGALRRSSVHVLPSELLQGLPGVSPLEAILELSAAWNARVVEVVSAGEFVRGEIDATTADALLVPVCRAHEPSWSFATRLADALERDVVDEELGQLLRIRRIEAASWLCRLRGIPLVVAMAVAEALERAEGELGKRGTLSRILAAEIVR